MAAGQLSKPGTKYGPCKTTCSHIDCKQTRQMAETPCRICSKRIGYGVLFFQEGSPKQLVHEECVFQEQERANA